MPGMIMPGMNMLGMNMSSPTHQPWHSHRTPQRLEYAGHAGNVTHSAFPVGSQWPMTPTGRGLSRGVLDALVLENSFYDDEYKPARSSGVGQETP